MYYFDLKQTTLPKDLAREKDRKWSAFIDGLRAAGIEEPEQASFCNDLKHAFLFSNFIFSTFKRDGEIFNDLQRTNDLYRSYSKNSFAESLSVVVKEDTAVDAIIKKVCRFRSREMVRIAFRDLNGQADLSETMADLSNLADACIDTVFEQLYQILCQKHGTPRSETGSPQKVVVLGLGKLGARELNFSSDVDLLFAFPETGHTDSKTNSLTNQEFFTRLSQNFLNVFSNATSSRLIFRIDLRLRPFGGNGPLVASFNALEEYYEAQGREWERYALIKSRVVAGDQKAGRQLLKRLNPFIYRRYLDYNTFDSLREMKQSIHREVQRKGLENNIKIGSGGIREIEFFGQVFQLIRGGVEPQLQETSILKVLDILADEKHIDLETARELKAAYYFLRIAENRLQEFEDLQTHLLPDTEERQTLLALSLGFSDTPSFIKKLEDTRKLVHHHFSQILSFSGTHNQNIEQENPFTAIWNQQLSEKELSAQLLSFGFTTPSEISRQIDFLQEDAATRALSPQGRRRLDHLMPLVLAASSKSENPVLAFTRITQLIKTIEQRTAYLSLLIENPGALQHLVTLSIASPWILSFLTRHPVLLDELLDARNLYRPPDREQIAAEIDRRMCLLPNDDLELQIEQLCIFKQVNILRVAAADISTHYPLMRVSDHLSDIAELVLGSVFQLSFNYLAQKHGRPICSLDSKKVDQGFAIIAYGKLGGIELGYGSDLDLVFLHASDTGTTDIRHGGRAIENSYFFSRLGQRIVHTLTTHTRAGHLYEIDMRLRPSGSSGPLVCHIHTFAEYQTNEAWTWEHQALIRARAVCGDPAVMKLFETTRKKILMQPRNRDQLMIEIRDMREKIRRNHDHRDADTFHLKQGKGGIIDIEFIVQYLILTHASKQPQLVRWSDNVRQLEALVQTGILNADSGELLKKAYLTFRKNVHHLNLQNKPPCVEQGSFQELQKSVTKIWETLFPSG